MKNQIQWNVTTTWELYSNETTSLIWGGIPVDILDAHDDLIIEEVETFSIHAQFEGEDVIWEPYDRVKKLCFRIPYRKDLYQIYETE